MIIIFYNYLFYLWYRFAEACSNPTPKYYACFALSMTQILLLTVTVKWLMYMNYLFLEEGFWRKILFLVFLITLFLLFRFNIIYFIRTDKVTKIIKIYKSKERKNQSTYNVHTFTVVALSGFLFIAAYLIPIKYGH